MDCGGLGIGIRAGRTLVFHGVIHTLLLPPLGSDGPAIGLKPAAVGQDDGDVPWTGTATSSDAKLIQARLHQMIKRIICMTTCKLMQTQRNMAGISRVFQ